MDRPIAPGSTRVRDVAHESARRSRWAHWPKSMARDDHRSNLSAMVDVAKLRGGRGQHAPDPALLFDAGRLPGGGTTSGAFPLPVAPADAGGARRVVARTLATDSVCAFPTDTRRPSAPRPPAWPIAPGSIRARDEPRESARRSRLEHWPRSKARDDHLGGPSAHSTTVETPGQRRELRGPGVVERWSGCHRSPVGVRRGPLIGAS